MTIKIWRAGHWLQERGLRLPSKMLRLMLLILFDSSLAMEVKPGVDIQMPHYGRGVGVHPQTKFGRDVILYSHAHLAADVPIGSDDYMVIGDRVSISAYAILIGPIEIGDDAVVGAGAVVTKSVPAGAIVAGSPARVLSMNGREFNAKRLRRPLVAA